MTSILSVKNLTVAPKANPNRLLVSDVSFSLKPGKTTCIVGESGSGKSLTALSIMGLLSKQLVQTQGSVVFKEQNLTQFNNHQLREIRGKKLA